MGGEIGCAKGTCILGIRILGRQTGVYGSLKAKTYWPSLGFSGACECLEVWQKVGFLLDLRVEHKERILGGSELRVASIEKGNQR